MGDGGDGVRYMVRCSLLKDIDKNGFDIVLPENIRMILRTPIGVYRKYLAKVFEVFHRVFDDRLFDDLAYAF